MRTAAICPTCATYTNAVCILYDGPFLSNIGVSPMDNLQSALESINGAVGVINSQLAAGYTGDVTIDGTILTFTNGILTGVDSNPI